MQHIRRRKESGKNNYDYLVAMVKAIKTVHKAYGGMWTKDQILWGLEQLTKKARVE